MEGKYSHANGNLSAKFNEELEKKRHCEPFELSMVPHTGCSYGPFVMPLLPIPSVEEANSKVSIVLAGTARRGRSGPAVGAVDIGVSKYAYFFRVSLPGVRKDPGLFSCEIEREGKVHVRGVTSTGGRTVSRHSRVYEMKFQQQCPPGPFAISFHLPGPVDPRLFSPHFRSDGILEGIIMKYE
ncbi:increased DNA methylation 3-like isoform X2 [Actinidia eriantha]|uniref:increased DNA methylation 3-like isoform X2 n=1 Tax=Actinidia eriantha TaxID=165200 RepID=UPI00258BF5BE|nr:increased DNA methylation 3-like isoform X2 [Actinidia eriantha]